MLDEDCDGGVTRTGEHVRVQVHDGIATVLLDRPPLNAIGRTVRDALPQAVEVASHDPAVAAVVVTGAGDVFAAGADIKEMVGAGVADVLVLAGHLQAALLAVATLPRPAVAAVAGYALGGGLELALACDFRIMAEDAKVGLPEITLGLIPGAGGTQRLARLVGPARAKELVFTGRHVGAEEALAIGLVDRVVPAAELQQAARTSAGRFVGGASVALAAAKEAIDRGLDVDLATGLQLERALFAGLFGTEDAQTGLRSFVEQGPGRARFEGR